MFRLYTSQRKSTFTFGDCLRPGSSRKGRVAPCPWEHSGGCKILCILSCLPFAWASVLGRNSECGATSPWCWNGQGPDWEGKRDVTLKGTSSWRAAAAELLLQARELQAGCHLPSPTQTKYPALRVSEKFLASACPGLCGLKSPSFMEPGLLSALSLFFLFLTPGD